VRGGEFGFQLKSRTGKGRKKKTLFRRGGKTWRMLLSKGRKTMVKRENIKRKRGSRPRVKNLFTRKKEVPWGCQSVLGASVGGGGFLFPRFGGGGMEKKRAGEESVAKRGKKGGEKALRKKGEGTDGVTESAKEGKKTCKQFGPQRGITERKKKNHSTGSRGVVIGGRQKRKGNGGQTEGKMGVFAYLTKRKGGEGRVKKKGGGAKRQAAFEGGQWLQGSGN